MVTLPEGLARAPEGNPPPKEGQPFTKAKPFVSVMPTPPTSAPPSQPRKATPPVPPPVRVESHTAAARTGSAPSIPRPTEPKADETHRLGYRIEGSGAVEVEGVCRFDESEIACWDGAGKPNEELADRIRQGLSGQEAYSNLSIRFGRKNRIVVVRQEQEQTSSPGPRRSINLQAVGTDSSSGSYINLPPESSTFEQGKPYVSRNARLVAEEKGARETKMRLMVSEPMPESPVLQLRKGATAELGGVRFTVESIQKGNAMRGGFFGGDTKDVWTVRLARSGKTARPAMFGPTIDTMRYVGPKGELVGNEVFQAWQRKQMEAAQKKGNWDMSRSPYRSIQIGTSMESPGKMEFVVNADPSKVGSIRIYGAYQRIVDVTGIPLDPQ